MVMAAVGNPPLAVEIKNLKTIKNHFENYLKTFNYLDFYSSY